MSSTTQFSKKDRRYLNYLTLQTVITKAMQRNQDRIGVNFELADELAWDVSQQIIEAVIIERARRRLTVDKIWIATACKKRTLAKPTISPMPKRSPSKPRKDTTALTGGYCWA
ncbi:hypothetical protein [Fodinibius sp.]|uniref:hypothetical protein n=1 Tax=Fodinibius sp. TaxID=1872440 RepID=UPI002ACDEBD9|nr:hypothetical protein [Fodinibius sp.]MDZ7657998.1 hypothetical protein [Fodinibius sp.]